MNRGADRRRAVFVLFVAICVGTVASVSADTPENHPRNSPGTFLNVTPSDNLADGQTVTVVGTGFAPDNDTGQIFQCGPDGFCRQPRIGTFTTDSAGTFTATVSVAAVYTAQGATTDCRVSACIVYALTGSPTTDAEHHLSFAGGPTTSTTSTSTTRPTTTTTRPTSTSSTLPRTTTTTSAPGTCGGLTPTIVGTGGADTIVGTPGPDVMSGGGGSDDIRGLAGGDVICGGAGSDRVVGGDGNDRLFGDAGQDQLVGGPGDDTLNGGGDADQCNGETGTDSAAACEVTTGLP